MASIEEQIQDLTDGALRRGAVLFAAFALPLVSVSVLRGVDGAWKPVFTLQIVSLLILLFVAALRYRIPRTLLGTIMLSICILTGWAGLQTYGVLGPAGHWLTASAMFFAGMLFGGRGMILSSFILVAGMLLIAATHLNGTTIAVVPAGEYVTSVVSWSIEILCALLFMALVMPTSAGFVSALQNLMSDVETRRDKIAHLAHHDELTGLPRLRVAKDRLSLACHRRRRPGELTAVMFIDLDGFKDVNDRFGHEAGDHCLQEVATRLSKRLRQQDTAARIGGDEFLVVLEAVPDRETTARLAAELIEIISRPIAFEQNSLDIGASIGIALHSENGGSADSLLRNADQAMYESKRKGSNGFIFSNVSVPKQATAAIERSDRDTVIKELTDAREKVSDTSVGGNLFTEWQDVLVTRSIVVIAAVLSLAVAANVWRIFVNGAAPNIAPTASALAVVLALLLLRQWVPLGLRMLLISSIGLLIGIPGLILAGLSGPGVGWALAASLFLFAIFYSWRVSFSVAVGVAATIALAGVGTVTGYLDHSSDVVKAANHPSAWLVFLLSALAFNVIVLSAWYLHKATTNRLMKETAAQIADMTQLATHDQLTGLPSLRLVRDRLNMVCSRASRAKACAAVMLLDLDGFKAINDSLGHDAGDHCLRELAKRMTSQVRAADTIARIGGDEFLVILDAVNDRGHVAETARRLLTAIAHPMKYGEQEFAVSGSMGVAMFPEHGLEGDALRKSADRAMYGAKSSGKNRMEFAENPAV